MVLEGLVDEAVQPLLPPGEEIVVYKNNSDRKGKGRIPFPQPSDRVAGGHAVAAVDLQPGLYVGMVVAVLTDNALFGASAVVLSSASSKTALGTAFMLSRRDGIDVAGLTSPGSVDGLEFVEGQTLAVEGEPHFPLRREDPGTVVDLEGKTVDLAPPWRRATMSELEARQEYIEREAAFNVATVFIGPLTVYLGALLGARRVLQRIDLADLDLDLAAVDRGLAGGDGFRRRRGRLRRQ